MNFHEPFDSNCCWHCNHMVPDCKRKEDIFKMMPKVFAITEECNDQCRRCPWWIKTKLDDDWKKVTTNIDKDKWLLKV